MGSRRKSSKSGMSASSKASHFESQHNSPALVPVGADIGKAPLVPPLALGGASSAVRGGGSLPVSRSSSPNPLSLIPLRRSGSNQSAGRAAATASRGLPRLRRASQASMLSPSSAGDTVGAGSETIAASGTRSSTRIKVESVETAASAASSFAAPPVYRGPSTPPSVENPNGATAAAGTADSFAGGSPLHLGSATLATTAAAAAAAAAAPSSNADSSDLTPTFRIECGSGTSHFVYDGLPILWRKASQKKEQHALVPTCQSISRVEILVL